MGSHRIWYNVTKKEPGSVVKLERGFAKISYVGCLWECKCTLRCNIMYLENVGNLKWIGSLSADVTQ